MGNKLVAAIIVLFSCANVVAGSCEAMAEMAYDVARLRDAGVPLAALEARLRIEVPKPDELEMAMTVARLVYATRGTAAELRATTLAKCK